MTSQSRVSVPFHFCRNQEPSTPHNLLMGVTTTRELYLFQVGSWSRKSYYGNNTKGVIYFFCDGHLWCQVSRTLLSYFQRYRLFSFYHFSVAVLYDIITDLIICILEKLQSLRNKKKRYFKKKDAILLYFERPFK